MNGSSTVGVLNVSKLPTVDLMEPELHGILLDVFKQVS